VRRENLGAQRKGRDTYLTSEDMVGRWSPEDHRERLQEKPALLMLLSQAFSFQTGEHKCL
jgi:hypothetical protein